MFPSIVGITRLPKEPLELLGQNEILHFNELPKYKKQDFLLGRIAVKNAFAKYHNNKRTSNITIANTDAGVPYISEYPLLHCSISHSYEYGLAGIAPERIGVDVEKVRTHKQSMLDFIAELAEIKLVQNFFSDSTDIITLIWVIKEAVMKGAGTGLSVAPKGVKIMARLSNSVFKVTLDNVWYVWPEQKGSYYSAIAYEQKLDTKPFIHWD